MKRLPLLLTLLLLSVPIFPQVPPVYTITGAITAASTNCTTTPTGCVVLDMNANGGSVIGQITGSITATIQFEGLPNGASTWVSMIGTAVDDGSTANSATAAGTWQFSTAGMSSFRMRASAFTSGPANVVLSSASSVSRHVIESGGGSVTSVATTAPLSGGTITTSGTLSCPTCVTSAAAVASTRVPYGAGTQQLATSSLLTFNSVGGTLTSQRLAADLTVTANELDITGDTTGEISIRGAADAGTWTMTLPVDDGTSGQFLKTDGSGVTSWAAAGGSVAIPATEIPFGNAMGDGLDSDAGFTFDPANPSFETSVFLAGELQATYVATSAGEGSSELHLRTSNGTLAMPSDSSDSATIGNLVFDAYRMGGYTRFASIQAYTIDVATSKGGIAIQARNGAQIDLSDTAVTIDKDTIITPLAAPMGQVCTVTVDDTGKLSKTGCM